LSRFLAFDSDHQSALFTADQRSLLGVAQMRCRADTAAMLVTLVPKLAYGGLKPGTLARLAALGQQLDGGKIAVRRVRGDDKPVAGTQLIQEHQGVEHVVTVRRASSACWSTAWTLGQAAPTCG
jgi:hypothetical protein